MKKYHICLGQKSQADYLVLQFHYSKRPPANVQQVMTWHEDGGLFGDFGEAVAACYFSIPPTRWNEEVWELSRLVRTEKCEANLTMLLSHACKAAKTKIDLLVSFADFTQGHHGGIYQAASWNYGGLKSRSMDGVLMDGVFVPGRSCNSRFGTRSPEKLTKIIGREVFPHYDEGKFLYWKPLSNSGKKKAEKLNLKVMKYPKPAMNAVL